MGKRAKKPKKPKKPTKRKAAPPARPEESLSLPRSLMEYMEQPEAELDDKVRAALDRVLEDERIRASLWLLAIVRKRTNRLIQVFEQMEEVADSLMLSLKSGNLEADDRVAFLKALQDEAEKTSKFIESMSSREMLSVILSSIQDEAHGQQTRKAEIRLPESFTRLSPQQRERVRRTLMELLHGQAQGKTGLPKP